MIQISFIINLHFSASVLTSGSRSVLLPVSSGSFSPDCFSCFHSKPNIPTRSGSRLAECFLLLLSESLFLFTPSVLSPVQPEAVSGKSTIPSGFGRLPLLFSTDRRPSLAASIVLSYAANVYQLRACTKNVSDSRRTITIRTSGTTRTASTVILAFLIFTFKAFRTSPQIQAAETAPAVWNPVSVFSSASEELRRVPNRE